MWITRCLTPLGCLCGLVCSIWRMMDDLHGDDFPQTISTLSTLLLAACMIDIASARDVRPLGEQIMDNIPALVVVVPMMFLIGPLMQQFGLTDGKRRLVSDAAGIVASAGVMLAFVAAQQTQTPTRAR